MRSFRCASISARVCSIVSSDRAKFFIVLPADAGAFPASDLIISGGDGCSSCCSNSAELPRDDFPDELGAPDARACGVGVTDDAISPEPAPERNYAIKIQTMLVHSLASTATCGGMH